MSRKCRTRLASHGHVPHVTRVARVARVPHSRPSHQPRSSHHKNVNFALTFYLAHSVIIIIVKFKRKKVTMNNNAALNLNYHYAGALIDANILISRGWTDLTGTFEDGEWVRYNSTWLEYTEKHNGLQYRIQCSLSCTFDKIKDNGFLSAATPDTAKQLHNSGKPRMVFFRRAHAWVLNAKAISYENTCGDIPDAIATRLEKDLSLAVIKPAKLFKDDITYQTTGLENTAPERKGSDVDQQYYILSHVASKELERDGIESVARFLVPLTRAFLTDDDPEGREYAMRISDGQVIDWIVDWSQQTQFDAACLAAFEIANRPGLRDAVSAQTWTRITVAALTLKAMDEAAEAMEIAFSQIKLIDDAERRSKLYVALYWGVVFMGNEGVKDADGFSKVVETFARHIDVHGAARLPRLWVNVARCHVRTLQGKKITKKLLQAVMNVLDEAMDTYETDHQDEFYDKPYLNKLPPGVKVPLEWQAMLYTMYGVPGIVLESFPTPPASDEKHRQYHPSSTAVEGLSFIDVWGGFESREWNNDIIHEWDKRVIKGLKEGVTPETDWDLTHLTVHHDIESYKILVPKHPEKSEISTLAVSANVKGHDKPDIIATFPFLPKEFNGNKPNIVVKLWRYHIWDTSKAADVEFTTESGQKLTAVMPYYIADYPAIARGNRLEGMLVGFADWIRKIDPPKKHEPITINKGHMVDENGGPVTLEFDDHLYDHFEQDAYPDEISGAGFDVQGRIESIRKLKALGKSLVAVEIGCEHLDAPLRIYIASSKLTDALNIGDTVVAQGWLYLDVFNPLDKPEEFLATFPVSAPPAPSDREIWESGIPTYIRTEYSDEERAKLPDRAFTPKWLDYGRRALERCDGVAIVKQCQNNPLAAQYIVKINGKVELYRMVIVKDNEKKCLDYVGLKTFILRLKSVGKGVNLTWENLPGMNNDDEI